MCMQRAEEKFPDGKENIKRKKSPCKGYFNAYLRKGTIWIKILPKEYFV